GESRAAGRDDNPGHADGRRGHLDGQRGRGRLDGPHRHHSRPDHTQPDRTRPDLDDATAEAVGRLSEALEWVERARGALYEFHQLSGRADLTLTKAITGLEDAGHARIAGFVRNELYGRNVLDGRWTFQIVEEYDGLYYRPFAEVDEEVRRRLTDGMRHVHEARMKARERARAGRDLWGPGA
ncbi:hypothetical protein ND748_32540, partial [Frankia sp. AiPs1]|uniref:hypothetical protein n=1 Tax=Frankia sp. AiPs1 TaxID=573493 RepID=UPI002043CEDE